MTADQVKDQRLRLRDGRVLGFRIYGDTAGMPVLFLHGTPGSRLKFSIAHEAGKSLRLAIVAPDRWGYGLTEAPSAPSLRGFADDMTALMNKLASARFAVGGISGGGPYAAAVAACLEPRIVALALVSPVGPIADAALGPSLPLLHRLCFTVLPGRPRAVSTAMHAFRWSLTHTPRPAGRLIHLARGSARQAADRPARGRPAHPRQLPGRAETGHRGAQHRLVDLLAPLAGRSFCDHRARARVDRQRGLECAAGSCPCIGGADCLGLLR